MALTMAIAALLLSFTPSKTQAQKALELPGMSVVAKHHGLSEATLQDAWMDHVREAVMMYTRLGLGWVPERRSRIGYV